MTLSSEERKDLERIASSLSDIAGRAETLADEMRASGWTDLSRSTLVLEARARSLRDRIAILILERGDERTLVYLRHTPITPTRNPDPPEYLGPFGSRAVAELFSSIYGPAIGPYVDVVDGPVPDGATVYDPEEYAERQEERR